MKEPLSNLLRILLKQNNIKVDEKELEFQLLSHPSYPSINSITGVLDHFKLRNYALEVPKDTETLNLLPSSFLTLIRDEISNTLVVASKINNEIQLTFVDRQSKFISIDSFLEKWTGVVVIIENDEQEPVKKEKKTFFSVNFIYLMTIVLLSIFFLNAANLFQIVHYLLTLTGVGICMLIVQHELGLHSKLLDKFCSEENKKTSCNAVMNSKGATLFGSLRFSDAGIIYFMSLLIAWSLLKISNSTYNTIYFITVLAIPFTFFSIFYQYKIVKKWCLLCLSVVSILWLQAASLYFIYINATDFSLNLRSVLLTAFCFLATFALWQFISPRLKKEQELKALKIDHFKFKRSYNIYKSLISGSEKFITNINDINEIVFGNNNQSSPLQIVIITNPLCGFCKESHELVENLLLLKGKNIQISIRFNVNEDCNSIDTRIALRLLELYSKEGNQVCLEAMHDIYGKYSPYDWLHKWNEPSEEKYIETLSKGKSWCKKNNINFTPEILVNGISFPKEYSRTDLLFFVEEIIEEEVERVNSQIPDLKEAY